MLSSNSLAIPKFMLTDVSRNAKYSCCSKCYLGHILGQPTHQASLLKKKKNNKVKINIYSGNQTF